MSEGFQFTDRRDHAALLAVADAAADHASAALAICLTAAAERAKSGREA